jgi:hypothetical protein
MSYSGPGTYRHYRGGTYTAIGTAEHETTGALFVVYESHSREHNEARHRRGADFIARPLNPQDGPDAWNTPVDSGERFTKVTR